MHYPFYRHYVYPVSDQIELVPDTRESTVMNTVTFTKQLLNHLQQRRGRKISVATPVEIITGTLEEVYSDHILVSNEGEDYHIRLEGIIYIN
ncbi:DUF2642 domain-containing protein [Aneurinibacillus tyrosinisolvens]|jgi:hypothetical protein|uniref:DUF2642 domain-containing protein n=1 Tax=Aneurinibacillus tyrosinisolvens TaxID=1443435 RepID=UPI00063FA1DF|nr:DUF2642 domain-containing protein [Aneurinibacillus tyrosinisolvens]